MITSDKVRRAFALDREPAALRDRYGRNEYGESFLLARRLVEAGVKVVSIAWMAFVAALIALEKLLPWRRAATYGTAGILLVLGILLVAAPDAIPGLTIPGGNMGMMGS